MTKCNVIVVAMSSVTPNILVVHLAENVKIFLMISCGKTHHFNGGMKAGVL